MFDQLLENTILLFVAVDPIALVPIFATLTKGLQKSEIKKIYSFFIDIIWILFLIRNLFIKFYLNYNLK